MGWKTRKDKLTSDQSAESEETSQEILSPETNAIESEQARKPFLLDLDNDAFGSSASHTSLDPAAFSWYQTAPIVVGDEPEEAPPAKPKAAQSPPAFTPITSVPNAFEEFATKPTSFAPGSHPDSVPLSGGQWDPQTPQRRAPASNTAQDQPYTPPGNYKPDVQPAFSEPGAAASWDYVEPNLGPSISNPVPSIEQLMTPPNHVPPPPAAHIHEPVPPVPDSFRPTFLQTQAPPQSSNYSQQGQHARHGREDVASGLVLQDNDLGIPKVAPFILNMGSGSEASDPIEQPTLVIRFKSLAARYTITKGITTLGRPDSDTGNYPDVEIDLDEGVSRKHAEIRLRGSRYYLIDLGSTNGTLLNGQAVIALTENVLTHGDRIRIGEMTEIVFE